MIDRSTAFWAWVWDNDPQISGKRFVIHVNEDDSCLTVSDVHLEKFKIGERFDAVGYNHYKKIPEPKKRLMTRKEILGFIAWNPHIVVRIQDGVPQTSIHFNFMSDIPIYSWAPITEAGEIGEWNKFEVSDEV
ncbi:MAG: hypothetical protein DRH37_00775 [Deltaproteobacteria bacterium]|nr:MAG: hypothetical protein DRH37_00775 [Deltaproteobacteria bacterium]